MPSTYQYYPALSNLIDKDSIPESLLFIQNELDNIFENIYYKNFIGSKSSDGSSAFYSLSIIPKTKIGFELFGSGISLILNPDYSDSNLSSFPITIYWDWKILRYFPNFKQSNFSYNPESFFELALSILEIDKERILTLAISTFVTKSSSASSFFKQLVSDVNLLYGSNIIISESDNDKFEQLVFEIESLDKNVYKTIFLLYLLNDSLLITKERLNYFFGSLIPSDLESYIKELFIPKIRATLTLTAALEFPRSVLVPMKFVGDELVKDETVDSGGNLKKSYFQFAEADFSFDTEGRLGADVEFAGSLIPQYNQIGNTGLIIGFTGVKLDLSRKTNIPEADAAGYPVDFVGVYAQQAFISFNKFGSDKPGSTSTSIIGENLLIGTGGISGRIALESNGVLYRKFGDFAVELNTFSLNFKFGSIVESDIAGKLTLNGFKIAGAPAVIDIRANIRDNGDFSLTAMPSNEPFPISLPNVFDFKVRRLSLVKEARGYYVEVAGILDFTADIPGLGKVLPTGINIEKLRIWDNGDIEFEGGSFVIEKTFKLKVGPVNLEVSHVSFGAYKGSVNGIERHYRFFGFDGMINIGTAGVKANGNGIKYYFTVDNNDTDKPFDSFTSIDGIGIDMIIPGNATKDEAAFILNGYLRMSNPDPSIIGSATGTEYTGAISFSLPKLGLEGSAAMRLKPSIPAFVVDIGLELPGPLPLGATGLGIYGFRGLIGQHYKASKSATTPPLPEDASWWEYYKAKSTITGQEGIELDKFADKPGYSVGAGASIATVLMAEMRYGYSYFNKA